MNVSKVNNMKQKTIKFPNGKIYTYSKYPKSKYWERTVGPEESRRKVRLHQDIKTNGKGEELAGRNTDVHHKDGNKNNNSKGNLEKTSHSRHTAIGKNAFKDKVKKYMKRQ